MDDNVGCADSTSTEKIVQHVCNCLLELLLRKVARLNTFNSDGGCGHLSYANLVRKANNQRSFPSLPLLAFHIDSNSRLWKLCAYHVARQLPPANLGASLVDNGQGRVLVEKPVEIFSSASPGEDVAPIHKAFGDTATAAAAAAAAPARISAGGCKEEDNRYNHKERNGSAINVHGSYGSACVVCSKKGWRSGGRVRGGANGYSTGMATKGVKVWKAYSSGRELVQ